MPTRAGNVPAVVSQAFDDGRFQVPSTPALGTSIVAGTWFIPVILIDFPDQGLTYPSAPEWDRALFDTTGVTATGSVYDYYNWVSGSRLKIIGKVVATVRLDESKTFYAGNSWGLGNTTPMNSAGAVLEALRKCDTQVNWSDFDRDQDGYVDMLWVVHSGLGGENVVTRQDLWSITSRLTNWSGAGSFTTSDLIPGTALKVRVDRFTILPELSAFRAGSRAEIGVFCHEFGHALGLPDLYDTAPLTHPPNVGPGGWSLMSTGAYGTDSQSPEYPSHLGAWPMLYLGWRTAARPTRDTLMTLTPIETGGQILELWFQGESNPEHFLIENRQRLGFDRNLPSEGALVYQVDDAQIAAGIPSNRVNNGFFPALRIIEGDGRTDLFQGINRGDPADPMPGSSGITRWADDTWPNTRSRLGNITNVALRDIVMIGDNVGFTAQVQSPGWLPARVQSTASYNPMPSTGPGTRAVMLEGGGIVAVGSEYLGGIPQVVVRTRHADGVWETPVAISQSLTGAVEPTVCAIPGGDICIVWSDARHGPQELYFRSRIRGVWTPERRLTDLPGFSRAPAMVADHTGSVQLVWQYSDGNGVRIYFMRFTYLSPFGDPWPVSAPGTVPDMPALALAPDGSSYALWVDQGGSQVGVWFAHCHPDSGVRPARRLIQPQGGVLPTVHAMVDQQGNLNALWATTGGGGSELHFHQRAGFFIRDTVLVRRGQPIQDFMIAEDPAGGVHVVMEAATSGAFQVLYKAWRSNGGWDMGNTEVTARDGVAVRPMVLLRDGTSLTVLYTAYVQGMPVFMERDRRMVLQPLTAVDDEPNVAIAGIRAGPNPLRAGKRLSFLGQGRPPRGTLDVFDLHGRRVARATFRTTSEGWRAEVPGSETSSWTPGVYFARHEESLAQLRVVVLR